AWCGGASAAFAGAKGSGFGSAALPVALTAASSPSARHAASRALQLKCKVAAFARTRARATPPAFGRTRLPATFQRQRPTTAAAEERRVGRTRVMAITLARLRGRSGPQILCPAGGRRGGGRGAA